MAHFIKNYNETIRYIIFKLLQLPEVALKQSFFCDLMKFEN